MKKNNFIKKKIKGIVVDVRSKDCLSVYQNKRFGNLY